MKLTSPLLHPPSSDGLPVPEPQRAGRVPSLLDSALEAVSRLAVVWAFGLALLLILAHRG